MLSRFGLIYAILLFLILTAGRSHSQTINSLSPASGLNGNGVTISGIGFGTSSGSSTVQFNGVSATVDSWNDSTILVEVPALAATGNVVVTVAGVPSNGVVFTVLPRIVGVTPISGSIGSAIHLSGTGFGATRGTGGVTVSGVAASISSWSSSAVDFVIPAGAVTGNVVLTTSAGLESNSDNIFTVMPPPSITSLSPISGAANATVTISGLNFGSLRGTGSVTFGGRSATVNSWTDTSISAKVPSSASSGSVVVKAVGGVASNGITFTVPPIITDLSPNSGAVGSYIFISGSSLGSSIGSVSFNGVNAPFVASWNSTGILAPVPVSATSGSLIVTSAGGTASNALPFTVVAPPHVTVSSTPAPNAAGWNATNVTVTFSCTAGSLPIAFCPASRLVSTEGANQVISGTATDSAGNPATASIALNIDKTGPAITVTSPVEGANLSSAGVTVIGNISDPASGVSTVECNGTPATINNGAFSCNILLNPGVNLIKLRSTDIAGNISGLNAHASFDVPLPAPVSLAITPATVNMVVNDIQSFSAVDDQNRVRTDAIWSVSDATIAAFTDSSSGDIAGVGPGQVIVTATLDGRTAQATVNVFSGTSLPVGTVSWFVSASLGSVTNDIAQATSVVGAPELYALESNSSGALVRALATDGRQRWLFQAPNPQSVESVKLIPDNHGGILVDYPKSRRIIDLDAKTGTPLWEYDLPSVDAGREIAVGEDGTVYLRQAVFVPDPTFPGITDENWSLIALNPNTGSPLAVYSVPLSTLSTQSSCGGGGNVFPSNDSFISNPSLGMDGTVFAETVVRHDVELFDCSGSTGFSPNVTISLLWAQQGSANVLPLHTVSAPLADGSDPSALLFEVVPDGENGVFASWGINGSRTLPEEDHISHFLGGEISDFNSPVEALQTVLGEGGILFVTDGGRIASINQNTVPSWTWTAPVEAESLQLVAATDDGGLVAKYTASGQTIVEHFDAFGTPSVDPAVSSMSLSAITVADVGDSFLASSSAPSGTVRLPAQVSMAATVYNMRKKKRAPDPTGTFRLVPYSDCGANTIERFVIYNLLDLNKTPVDFPSGLWWVTEHQSNKCIVEGCSGMSTGNGRYFFNDTVGGGLPGITKPQHSKQKFTVAQFSSQPQIIGPLPDGTRSYNLIVRIPGPSDLNTGVSDYGELDIDAGNVARIQGLTSWPHVFQKFIKGGGTVLSGFPAVCTNPQ